MRAYGLKRIKELEFPDVDTIITLGLHCGKLHPPFRHHSNAKDRARRGQKKSERYNIELGDQHSG